MKKIFLSLLLAVCLSACSHQYFEYGDRDEKTEPTYRITNHFFVDGIGQTKKMDPVAICGRRGVKAVSSYQSFGDGFLGVITLGIYTPRTALIYCNE